MLLRILFPLRVEHGAAETAVQRIRIVQPAAVLADDLIRFLSHGGFGALKQQLTALIQEMVEKGVDLSRAKSEFERQYIKRVIDKNRGNKSRAARELGLHRNTLAHKIRSLGIGNNSK